MPYATSLTISTELLELASSKVDELTFNRIQSIGFDNLTNFQKNCVTKATLYQAEHYENYGSDNMVSGFSLPGISLTMANNSDIPEGVSAKAYSVLKQSGLMYRGV